MYLVKESKSKKERKRERETRNVRCSKINASYFFYLVYLDDRYLTWQSFKYNKHQENANKLIIYTMLNWKGNFYKSKATVNIVRQEISVEISEKESSKSHVANLS